MKNIDLLFVLKVLVIFGMSGCSEENPVYVDNRIIFHDTDLARSVIEKIEDMKCFSVWGQHTDGSGTAPSVVFDARLVSREKEGGWTYEGTEYWNTGTYDFYALFPIAGTNIYQLDFQGRMPTGIKNFNIKEHPEDLMFDILHKTYPFPSGESRYVAVRFKHLLSMIDIKIRKDQSIDYGIFLTGVSVFNLPVQGNCTFNDEKKDWSFRWSFTDVRSDSDTPSYSSSEEIEMETAYKAILSSCLVFPQSFTSNNSLRINLRYRTSEGKEIYINKEIKGLEIKAGKRYNFTLTIKPLDSIILEQVEAEEWGSALAGSIILPV